MLCGNGSFCLSSGRKCIMRKWIVFSCAVLLLVGLLSVVGCEKKAAAKPDVTLCAKCGQVKGSDTCCAPDAQKCTGCGLAKGSTACCQGVDFSKGDVTLCAKCGETKGSDKCCKPDAEKCPKCGLAKGSVGCCKI